MFWSKQKPKSSIGVIVGHQKLKTNPRFIQVDVEMSDTGEIWHFVERCIGVIKLNERTCLVYK